MSRRSIGSVLEDALDPSSLAMRIIVPILGIGMTVFVWTERGAAIGLIAALVYGIGFSVVSFRLEAVQSWSKAHPVLDSLGLVPLMLLAVAVFTSWPIAICLAISVAAWVALTPIAFLSRRRPQAASRAVRSDAT